MRSAGRASSGSPAWRLDAALYEPAALRLPGTNGRPRIKGARLPNMSDILAGPDTAWQQVMVSDRYSDGERIVQLCSATAVWRHAGMPIVPIRWVLVRDPLRRFEPQAPLCTGLACALEQILRWFVRR